MTTGRVLAASPRSASQISPGWGFIEQVEDLLFGGARARDIFGQRNRALGWVLAATISILALVLAWPPARQLFHFGPLHADDLGVVAAAVVITVGAIESLKRFWLNRLLR